MWSNIANLHENSGISIIKSVANLKISWSFFIRKILRSTRTLDCDQYRLKSKGKFFSFCWAIFLYFSTPISWVMSYDKKCPRFVDPVRGWDNIIFKRITWMKKHKVNVFFSLCQKVEKWTLQDVHFGKHNICLNIQQCTCTCIHVQFLILLFIAHDTPIKFWR